VAKGVIARVASRSHPQGWLKRGPPYEGWHGAFLGTEGLVGVLARARPIGEKSRRAHIGPIQLSVGAQLGQRIARRACTRGNVRRDLGSEFWGIVSAAINSEARSDGAQILVVDDNPDLRTYMSRLLAPHYRVVTAGDGSEALAAIREKPFDLVLSDVMMPRMSGIELVQALRSDPHTLHLPVILLSARAGEEAIIEGRDAGSDDYLTKPFTAQELLARVRSHLNLARARNKWASELERANRELDAFSYSVAHDLRAPLRTIDGFVEMTLEDCGEQIGEDGRRHLDVIRKATQRMTQLIDDLLYLARIARGEARRTHFDLSELVLAIVSRLQAAEPDRRVLLDIEQNVRVEADAALVTIVLENLLGNAWKFTSKQAQGEISFGVESSAGETRYFIRDNGAGFNMKYASKLFGVFQRLHSDSDFKGTGVGLATVKRVVDRHGGRVWAQGEPGAGATFYFTLRAV
jgi:signal transduction histidine kinase